MKPVIVSVRDKRYYVCEYTGAPTSHRFFIPSGKSSRQKVGCFANLPIALRWLHEQEGGFTEEFDRVKRAMDAFYGQPDIPLAPILSKARVPLSETELDEYMEEMEMGLAWRTPAMLTRGLPLPALRPAVKKRKVVTEDED